MMMTAATATKKPVKVRGSKANIAPRRLSGGAKRPPGFSGMADGMMRQ